MTQSVIGALRVNLALDSAKFERGANRSQNSLKKLRGQFALVSAAAAAMGAALGGLTISAGRTATEISRLAQVANTTPEILQKWSAGAKTVGIEQEKLADILKDVNDRVGDFVTTGGGPMADFFEKIAPRIGITADAFRGLSGPDALQLYVSSLEKANVSQEEFTFFMEAMASDSTLLLPLLRDNASEMSRLAESAESLGAIMDNKTVAALNRMNIAVGEVSLAFQGIKNRIAAEVAPSLEALAVAFTNSMREGGFLRIVTDGLINNLDRMAVYVGTAVALVGGRFVVALVAAKLATFSLAGAMTFLKGAIIRTGFGALIVGAGELVYQFSRLLKATGGWGAALTLLGDVAKGVWEGIKTSASSIVPALGSVWETIKAGFMSMIASVQRTWADFLHTVTNGLRDVPGAEDALMAVSHAAIMAGSAVYETEAAVTKLQDSADALRKKAKDLATKGFEEVKKAAGKLSEAVKDADDAVEEVGKTSVETTDSVDDLSDAMGNGGAAAKELSNGLEDLARGGVEQLVDNMVDGFKGGIKSIKQIFVDTIKQMIAFAIKNKIMISLGLGGIGGAAAAGGGGSILSGLGGLGGIGSAFMGGLGSVATGLMTGGLSGGIGAIGTALSGATSGLAGLATAAGALAGPIALVAGAISFFRSKTKVLDSGLKVTANSAGTLVQEFENLKKTRFWGLSRKYINNIRTASEEVAGPIQAAVDGMRSSAIEAAEILGFGSAAFRNFSHSFKLSLKGMTEEQAMQAITQELGKMGDAMASMIPHVSSLNELIAVAQQRWQLQNRVLELQGRDEELLRRIREQQLNATHKLNRSILQTIFRLEDQAAATEKARLAAEELAARQREISNERLGLENELLRLQGNTAELRRRELEALYPANRALQRMIWGLEDAKRAMDDLDPNNFASKFAFERARGLAMIGLGSANSPNAPIYTPSVTSPVASDAATVVELSKFRQELRQFRDEQRQLGIAVSANTKRTSDTLRKFDIDGMPAVRT